MASERDIARWIERGLDAIDVLTKQVSRAAYALEVAVVRELHSPSTALEVEPCPACQSILLFRESESCHACGMPKKVVQENAH